MSCCRTSRRFVRPVLVLASLFAAAPAQRAPGPAGPAQPGPAGPAAPRAAAPVERVTAPAPRTGSGSITIGKDGFVLPEGAVGVDELIDAAARYLARNILWQPQELQNQPALVFQKALALDALGCEEMLGQLLATRNLAIVPIDARRQVYEVMNLQGPRAREAWSHAVWRTPEEVLQRPGLQQIVLVSVPLHHVNATVAANALRPFFAANVNSANSVVLGTAGTNEALLVTGFTDQVANCIRLLQQCDQPLQERNPEMFQLSQAVTDLQNAATDLRARLATMQKQIAELQQAQTAREK